MKERFNLYLGLLILLFFFSGLQVKSQAPAYRQFTDDDGLPSMTVYGIKQDKDGFLWIATVKGICRFDGKEFKKYFIPDMKGQDFPYIFMDETGTPWFYNLAGEVFYVKDDTVRRFDLIRPGDGFVIYSFLKNENYVNVSWTNNDSMISIRYHIKNNILPTRLNIGYIYFGLFNNELIGLNSSYGIEINNIDRDINISKHDYNILETHNYGVGINEFKQISKDSFVIITSFFAAIYNGSGKPIKILKLRKLLVNPIIHLSFVDKYNLFIKTVDNAIIYNYVSDNIELIGNESQSINSIFVDSYQRRWISTTNKGLFLQTSDAIIYNSNNSNLNSNEVIRLYEDDNNLFYGHENGSVSIYNLKLNSWSVLKGAKLGKVRQIKRLDKSIYIIAYDNGINILNLLTKNLFSIKNSMFNGIKNIFVDSNSCVYVLTRNGIYKLNKENLLSNRISLKSIKLLGGVRCIDAIEYNDTIFVATNQGIYKLKGSTIDKFSFISGVVNKLFYSCNYGLIVCTDNDGLMIFEDEILVNKINQTNGLASNSVSCVTELSDARLLIATDNGCFVYNQLDKKCFPFDKLDCLPSNEIYDLLVLNRFVYVATYNGVFRIREFEIKPNIEIPFFKVTSAYATKGNFNYSLDQPLKYSQNHVKINFSTRSLVSHNKWKIKYQLKGGFNEWVVTNNNSLDFIDLNYNKYQLNIKFVNEDNIEFNYGNVLAFEILPPWWKAIWFNMYLLTMVILFFLCGVLLIVILLRLKYKRNARIVEQINQLKLEALQNQMNPHFIFNSLNAIQGFLGFNDEAKSMRYMSELGKLMRVIFEHSRLKSISLEQEINLLWSYIKLEQLRFGANLDIHFEVDPILEDHKEYIKISPLLIQPILENSFRHGLLHSNMRGKISVDFKYKNDLVICIVKDNGIGRINSRKINDWRRKDHVSTGISSIAERIKIIDKFNGILSLDIEDTFDKDGNPNGTCTTIVLQYVDKFELVNL